MKNFVQMFLSRTALAAVMTVAVSFAFASAIAAPATAPSDAAPTSVQAGAVQQVSAASLADTIPNAVATLLSGIVPANGGEPEAPTFVAPSVAHSVEGQCADEELPFPYQLNLVGLDVPGNAQVLSFNLYIVDTATGAVITDFAEHLGTIISAGTATPGTSARGDYIRVMVLPSAESGRVHAHLTVLLQHGQEVVITTSVEPGYDEWWSESDAIGLVDFDVISYFLDDGSSATDGFGSEHADYTFHFDNPGPPLYISPEFFHGGPVNPADGQGFMIWTVGNIGSHIMNSTVRVEAVWTLDGDDCPDPCTCGYENCPCTEYTPGCNCEQQPGQPCDVCNEYPCVCPEPGQPCDVCNEYPCVCPEPGQPCDVCNEYPCVCPEPGQPCDVCGEDPCVCPADPGRDPGDDPGDDPGRDPGDDPGDDPGAGDGRQPGVGPQTGDHSNAVIHLMHMLLSAVVAAVLIYRFTCPSEALARRKS